MTKTPEQWLEEAAPDKKGGTLKLFLGYAPGVGKTYNMLSEAIRRKSRGEDVVIGVVETHGRKGVVELASQTRNRTQEKDRVQGNGVRGNGSGWNTRPQTSRGVVDELAHTNIEGSRNRKRYEDVLELVDADI